MLERAESRVYPFEDCHLTCAGVCDSTLSRTSRKAQSCQKRCAVFMIFQNVKYICLQKLATDASQFSNKGKSSPPNPKEQQKDVTGLSSSVYTTPSHDPNHESINRTASPDPNSPSSIPEYESENLNTIPSFLPAVNHTGHPNSQAVLNLPHQNKEIDRQKFVAGHLPQYVVDSFYSKSSKTEVNINKVSTKLPDANDNKLLLMSVELGMIPESVQLLCSELTPCKSATKVPKVNDADSIKNLITNIEEQCKLLNGVCQKDYNKLFLIALELGSIPQGLQTFFNEHFFVKNTKLKENDLPAEEITHLTENTATKEKFSVGVTSILSLLYGSVPRIFDEYLNMSNSVNDNIQRTTLSLDTHYLDKSKAQKRDIFENTPSSAQSHREEETSSVNQKVSGEGNHSNTPTSFYSNTADTIESIDKEKDHPNIFTNFYSNTADTIEFISNEKYASSFESFPTGNNPLSELHTDVIKPSGVFGVNTPRCIKQVGDPNHEISPKMTNPAPKSPNSINTEENAISVGQPSPSIQPEETCKHCLLSAQHDPGFVKEVPIILSTHIDKDLTPPLTKYKKSSTDFVETKLKNVKKSLPEQSEELTHPSNIQNMKLCLLTAELGILTKHTMLYCSKLSSPPITSSKVSTPLEQQELSNIKNLFLVMLECGILPVGIKTVTQMDSFHKSCKSGEVMHKPEPMQTKHALIQWKSAPNALIIYKKEFPVVPIAPEPVTVNISELIKRNTEKFLQSEKWKECLHIFEIPLFYEEDSEISTVEYVTDACQCDSKTGNLYDDVCSTNTTMVVPGKHVQHDNVSTKTSNSHSSTPAGTMEQNVSNYKSHNKNSDNLPMLFVSRKLELEVLNNRGTVDNVKSQKGPHRSSDNLPVLFESRKLELEVLNNRGTVDNVKSQISPHRSSVKLENGQIPAHEVQETDIITHRETMRLNLILEGSELCNSPKYLHFASNIVKNPERIVQNHMESKSHVKNEDLAVSKHKNDVKPNVMEKQLSIVSPVLNTHDTLSNCWKVGEKEANNKSFVFSPKKTVMLPALDTNDTLSISCNVGKEKSNNKNFVVSPEKMVTLPVLDTNDTLSISCNVGRENVYNKNIGSSTVLSPILDTNDTLSISCNVGRENVYNKNIGSSTVLSPILDTNDTLSVSCNIEKEKANNKNFVVSPKKTVTLPVLDMNDTLSFSCNGGKENVNNKNIFSPTVMPPVLDTTHNTLAVSCNVGKQKVNNKNVGSPTVMSLVLDTKDTLSMPCNVEKEKVENLISDENISAIPEKNIVSVFFAKLCKNSKILDSNKYTHTNKQDTVGSKVLHNNGDDTLNFTNKAQRSIEAIIKAVTDKYNNSVNKLSAHGSSKSDSLPNALETSDFHMADIFKQHIWKPITLNIWKVFDYLNNMNLHKASTNLDLKHDFPKKLESCDLEVYQKLNSQFLLTHINDSNLCMISKYKYFSELCPEPLATYPELELESVNKEDINSHIEICSAEATGPSSSVFVVCDGEVGPGASKSGEYKNPEYFSYHKESYFEAEVEMLKYRLPQPSSQEK